MARTSYVASARHGAWRTATGLNLRRHVAGFCSAVDTNPIECSVQQELKRRTVKVRVFPSDEAILRLVSAVLVEIDEKWASETKAYIKWECQDA